MTPRLIRDVRLTDAYGELLMGHNEAEVLVVGAGTSGIPAAIGAARCGAKVVLLEQSSTVGGTITHSYVLMPCGGPRTGIYKEMIDHLVRDHRLPGGTNWFLPWSWLSVMNQMLRAETGITVLCGADTWEPIIEDAAGRPRVRGLVIKRRDGTEKPLRARVTIDATGTGAVAHAVACESMYGQDAKSAFGEPHAPERADPTVQHCTWMCISQRIGSGPAFDMMRLQHVKLGVLVSGLGWFHSNPDEALSRDLGIYLHWGCAVECRNTLDPLAVADAQGKALMAMGPDIQMLRGHGFAVYLAPWLGIRETRRIIGDHVITENDLRSGVLPEDTIAIGTYGLDLWGTHLSREETRVPGYGIPYRALLPKGVDGILLAGKSISGTHIASSAYRVQPILAAAGQAAGVAAALAAQRDTAPRDLNPEDIRRVVSGPGQNGCLQAPEAG